MIRIFHHNDMDGKCSAAIICDNLDWNDTLYKLYMMDYTKPFPIDSIKPKDEVWIVDYHITKNEMQDLLDTGCKVIWIDHHKSALKEYDDLNVDIEGLRTSKYSGCVLTYMFVYGVTFEEVPYAVRLIGDYDTYQFQYTETKDFFFGLAAYDSALVAENDLWNDLLEPLKGIQWLLNAVCKKGQLVNSYRKQFLKGYFDSFAFQTIFEGKTAYAMNVANFGDEAFWPVLKDNSIDIFVSFVISDRISFSLYSRTLDVSGICKSYGGGGHSGAGGFNLDFNKGMKLINDLLSNKII